MNWQTLAGPKHNYSAVAKNSDGRLELLALAEDGSLQHCWQSELGDSATWSDWSSLGKGEWNEPGPHSFAVGLSDSGCLEVFVVADGNYSGNDIGNGIDADAGTNIGTNGSGQIFHNRQIAPGENAAGSEAVEGCQWTGWHTLEARYPSGWSTIIGATVVRDAEGLLNLFVMSANRGALREEWLSDYTNSTGVGHYQQTSDGKWSGPELCVYIETCIDAGVEVEGRADYRCKSKLPVKLIAALNSDHRLELFANAGGLEAKRRGVSGTVHVRPHLWYARQKSDTGKNWGSDALPMPPAATGRGNTEYDAPATQPSVIVNHEGNLEVYVWGNTDHGIWVRKEDPSVEGRWPAWHNIGDSREWRRPMVVGDRNNVLTVLASSMISNTIWYLTQFLDDKGRAVWPGEWHAIAEDGDDGRTELVHAVTNQDGRIELFASQPDSVGFVHKYQDKAGQWS